MTHACLTVAIPFADAQADAVETVLERMGNPPRKALQDKLDELGTVHFMSAVVVRETGKGRAHLMLEISADGAAEEAARRIADALEAELRSVLDAAGVPHAGRPLEDILLRRNLRLGHGWFSTAPGVVFVGVPAMSVRRIRDEAKLAAEIGGMREVLEGPERPMRKLRSVRERLWEEEKGRWKWAFAAEPTPFLRGGKERTTLRVLALAALTLAALLWPLLAVPVVLSFLVGIWPALLTSALLLVLAGAGAIAWLRRLEERDEPDDIPPRAEDVAAILDQENRGAQNLLLVDSRLKPGRFRRLALRFALGMVAQAVLRIYRPGFLRSMGVIHFARWTLLPGTDRLLFFSNFSNSWESYLGDFIAKTPSGITSIWSNARGFPRARLLFGGGVADASRFLRWARRKQVTVPFWYSGYPDLTMSRIRTNAAIREGIAAASTEGDAADWLACFGGAPRPAAFALDKPEIPTLAFGGLGKLRYAHCFVLAFPAALGKSRAWLQGIESEVTFGDHAHGRAVALGLSAEGLRKLGMAEEDLATFPVAFQHGMAAPCRARVLGDLGEDDAARWAWGQAGTADVFLVLYHADEEGLGTAVRRHLDRAEACGLKVTHDRRLEPLRKQTPGKRKEPEIEPFGFADGISQPILRGTPKARRADAADHVVEAGELILGYPDNSGYLPPMPSIAANQDRDGLLPALGTAPAGARPGFPAGGSDHARRDLGRNGTFLVVRQLDQYPEKLKSYVAEQAGRLLVDKRCPWQVEPEQLPELLEAKMVGRWKDGRSLLRQPHPLDRADGHALKDGDKPDDARKTADNDFRFAREDPQGLHCPFGAHIRRVNPRDALDGGATDPMADSNRHRVLRVGRSYKDGAGGHPGLIFMCLNADIERQFEFVQRNWVLGRSFHDTIDEDDPLVGHARDEKPRRGVFTIPTLQGPVQLRELPDFVRVRGGGYFFMPGRRALHYLAKGTFHRRDASGTLRGPNASDGHHVRKADASPSSVPCAGLRLSIEGNGDVWTPCTARA